MLAPLPQTDAALAEPARGRRSRIIEFHPPVGPPVLSEPRGPPPNTNEDPSPPATTDPPAARAPERKWAGAVGPRPALGLSRALLVLVEPPPPPPPPPGFLCWRLFLVLVPRDRLCHRVLVPRSHAPVFLQ
ncbi:unnamed protein product [Lota lota]